MEQLIAVYNDHSLNIFTADQATAIECIHLATDTYILQSTAHLGILTFDDPVGHWWVLSFQNEPSAVDCASTLRNCIGMAVADVKKVLSDRVHLEDSIVNTIMDVTFPHFVANMENAIMKKTQNTFDQFQL